MDTRGIQDPVFFIGVVEDNIDERHEGRVRVRAFGFHGKNTEDEIKTKDLPWAICASGNYDPNNPPPPLNSFVYGMFLDGNNAQHPLVLGLIPSQYAVEHDPRKDGWGVIPGKDAETLAKGMDPRNFGLPQLSKLAHGEALEETYLLEQNLNRKHDQKVANSDETWAEPPSAYAAKYPYNKVIETGRHSIEIDDTPGGERIMIHHNSGAYIQIDAKGTVTERAEADRYEINIGTKHESSGHSVVTINGNAHVYVKGNKTEEIEGDYNLLVHGNSHFGTGGQMNINGGEQLQMRAGDVKVDANVGIMNLFAKESLVIEGGDQFIAKANAMNLTSILDMELYSTLAMKVTSVLDFTVSSNDVNFNTGTGGFNLWGLGDTIINSPYVKTIGTLQATAVAGIRGDFTTLGAPLPSGPVSYNGAIYSAPVDVPTSLLFTLPELNFALPALFAGSQAEMPEPPSKSTSIFPRGYFAQGYTSGYISNIDDGAKSIASKFKKGII